MANVTIEIKRLGLGYLTQMFHTQAPQFFIEIQTPEIQSPEI